MSFWGKSKEEPAKGGWELHPCTPPSADDIYAKGYALDAVIDNVWTCGCGRRWRLLDISMEDALLGNTKLIKYPFANYEEVLEFTDTDFTKLLEETR